MLLAATHAMQTSAKVVELMYGVAGTSAIYTRSPLERHFRDIQVLEAARVLLRAATRRSAGPVRPAARPGLRGVLGPPGTVGTAVVLRSGADHTASSYVVSSQEPASVAESRPSPSRYRLPADQAAVIRLPAQRSVSVSSFTSGKAPGPDRGGHPRRCGRERRLSDEGTDAMRASGLYGYGSRGHLAGSKGRPGDGVPGDRGRSPQIDSAARWNLQLSAGAEAFGPWFKATMGRRGHLRTIRYDLRGFGVSPSAARECQSTAGHSVTPGKRHSSTARTRRLQWFTRFRRRVCDRRRAETRKWGARVAVDGVPRERRRDRRYLADAGHARNWQPRRGRIRCVRAIAPYCGDGPV